MGMKQRAEKQRRSVLVVNGTEYFELFHEFLTFTLHNLGFKVDAASNWQEATELLQQKNRYELFVIDPRVEDFETKEFDHLLLQKLQQNPAPMVAIRLYPEDDAVTLDGDIEAIANISKTFSPQEMAFVFHRVLHPEVRNLRRHPRALASVIVEYRKGLKQKFQRRESFNLSMSGLFLRSQGVESVGTSLELRVDLPDGQQPFSCYGQVVFSKTGGHELNHLIPDGMGIQFLAIKQKDKERLSSFTGKNLLEIDQPIVFESQDTSEPSFTESA